MDIKERIMSIAQDLIQKEGINSFSFRTLAEQVDIKSASVHYHFPKKDDLLTEIAKKYNSDFFNRLEKIENSKLTAKRKILDLLKIFEETKKNNKICLCAMFSSMSESLSESSIEELDFFFNNLSKWISNILTQAKESGDLKSNFSLTTLTNLIIASFEGALLIDRRNGDYKHLKSCKELINNILK